MDAESFDKLNQLVEYYKFGSRSKLLKALINSRYDVLLKKKRETERQVSVSEEQ